MRSRSAMVGLGLLLACSLVAGCGGNGSNDSDAGVDADAGDGRTPCVDDEDCRLPETCQPDGYCEYQPDQADDNKLGGVFDCEMNVSSYGESEVTGKFKGRYVYMEYPGCRAKFDPEEDAKAVLTIDGLVTNALARRLVLKVPHDSPVDTAIRFGAEGVGSGVFKHAELNQDGYTVGETPVAEVVGGHITFSDFSNAQGNTVKGTFSVELRPIEQD